MPEIRLIQMTKNIEPDWRAKNIGFIGLGLMGAPMIRNLCATGANTYVWNRSSATAKEFAKEQKNITGYCFCYKIMFLFISFFID